jgi:ABC-2 type transport system permease protein
VARLRIVSLNFASGGQLRAVAVLRIRLLLNSLRSVRHRLNLVSRIVAGILVLGAGLGGGFAIAVVTWEIAKAGRLEWLTIPFWLIFFFWQLFPIMASAFNENLDASGLLRFPLGYKTYLVVRLIYGALDIPTALGLSWSLGIFTAVFASDVRLTLWAAASIALFATFNILLARAIFVWIERWLSTRRSREIMGIVFFLVVVGFQLAGPLLGRLSDNSSRIRLHVPAMLLFLQQTLPPGLTTSALAQASHGHYTASALSILTLGAFNGAAFWLLHMRLRDQFKGENPSEGEKRRVPAAITAVNRGWNLPGIRGPLAAVYEKEIRYFSRSGPLLFTLIMPLVVVLVLWGGRRGILTHQAGFALPAGAAYCLLLLTNIVYNSFGADAGGIQFFLTSPVSFRLIAGAKNLAQLTVLALDVVILWIGIRVVYQPPAFDAIALTFAWYLFAIPVNLCVGNLLSVYSPRRTDFSTFGRQRPSESTIIVSLLVQMACIGVSALAVFISHRYSNLWIATLILLALAVPALAGYFVLLLRLDRIVMRRREVLTADLCKV